MAGRVRITLSLQAPRAGAGVLGEFGPPRTCAALARAGGAAERASSPLGVAGARAPVAGAAVADRRPLPRVGGGGARGARPQLRDTCPPRLVVAIHPAPVACLARCGWGLGGAAAGRSSTTARWRAPPAAERPRRRLRLRPARSGAGAIGVSGVRPSGASRLAPREGRSSPRRSSCRGAGTSSATAGWAPRPMRRRSAPLWWLRRSLRGRLRRAQAERLAASQPVAGSDLVAALRRPSPTAGPGAHAAAKRVEGGAAREKGNQLLGRPSCCNSFGVLRRAQPRPVTDAHSGARDGRGRVEARRVECSPSGCFPGLRRLTGWGKRPSQAP
jgi:hypothetical protein